MALRNIMKHTKDDDALRKKAKYVTKINRNVCMIIDDMSETMYSENGVGMAANQVGVLRRLIVIDIGDGLIKLINPVIDQSSGEQVEQEGCLSIPDVWGMVKRPEKVTVRAFNEKGKRIEIKGEGLLARVLCHEIDHLNGVLFIDKAQPGTLEKSGGKSPGL
jgi:peptide deformylase